MIPDFIYDAARLYHLVLVGYSANDPPMRYLLNAVAADGSRFDDLKERFTFFGMVATDAVAVEDWRGRGITPIGYDSANEHAMLGELLAEWARLSAVNGDRRVAEAAVRRAVRLPRDAASEANKDLFDHLFRRSNAGERLRIAEVATDAKADASWLEAMCKIGDDTDRRRSP